MGENIPFYAFKPYYGLYYQADIKLQRIVAVLPWGHNILLVDKELPLEQILFYSQEAVQKGWKKDLLHNAIKMNAYTNRQSQIKTNNFDIALPEAQADYANEVFLMFFCLKKLSFNCDVLSKKQRVILWVKIRTCLNFARNPAWPTF